MNQISSPGARTGFAIKALSVALLAACVVSSAAANAQKQRKHRFYLPWDPYRYGHKHIQVSRGLDRDVLRRVSNEPAANRVTDAGAALGRVLFYDRRLSQNKRVSCASCHKQAKGFADRTKKSRGFERKLTRRNSMGLTNLAYYRNGRFFWDERGKTLEEMVLMPIQDPVEMGMDMEQLVTRLKSDTGYRWLFRKAFGDSRITSERIGRALAQFLRSMVSFRSKFDKGLARAGRVERDFPNFTRQENLGKQVFLGLNNGGSRRRSCASCHMQKVRSLTSRHVLPVLMQSTEALNNGVDPGIAKNDPGRGGVTGRAQDQGKFKAPSLRNIAITGPYMHDGRFRYLPEVIDMYSKGLHRHPNLDSRLEPTTSRGWGRERNPITPPRNRPNPVTGSRTTSSTASLDLRGEDAGARTQNRRAQSRRNRRNRDRDRDRNGVPRTDFGFQFSKREKRALISFLKTLTDWELTRDRRFSDPFRKRRR